ncbi:MAG: Glycosyl transferase family 2 [Candidatus Gottesmanbacteria bacterium GW2011_GWA1_34_13]|uniref:Glycosyl transferase family 2 n=1 Tax=Candidatus Gottesmanbacteria bacterium GW2011_GWA1_34_13 TaxID=1618434 RepID=A0A0G0D896_9BACT|nr:MAG: Glycosyl transferase family 2 [Candidatus Gottesmanbacteria bacterium GW2011_GWA1_34_13]
MCCLTCYFLSINMKITHQNQDLVSVIMPVRNGSVFMVKAINSIVNQTYKNWELLIIDDASSDSTRTVMQEFKKQYPAKIRLFKTKRNLGAFAAANTVIQRAKGKYLAPMDSDDIAHFERLEKQVKFLHQNPNVILVGSNAEIIDQNDNLTGYKKYGLTHEEIYQQMSLINPIVHPSCMIRKSMLPNPQKLYLTNFGVNSDYFTFFQLLNYGKFANLPENLLSYRIHGKNSSLVNLKAKFFNTIKIRLAAVKEFKYQMPFYVYPLLLIQVIIVSFIPGKLLLPIYLFIRGMRTQMNNNPSIMSQNNTLFNRVKYALTMLF